MYPVLVKQIKITRPTMSVTGLSSYDEIVAKKATLFGKQTDNELTSTFVKIHGGKIDHNTVIDTYGFSQKTKEEKRKACINALTFQLELTQEVTKPVNENASPILGMFLSGRANVSSTNPIGIKYFYQVCSFQFIQDNNFEEGSDLSKHYADKNELFYLLRTHTFNPLVNKNGMITESPKRTSKGGNILLKDNKLIFQPVSIVWKQVVDVETELQALTEMELQNAKDFIANSSIESGNIPEEIKQGDIFNEEFQDWLQDQYATRNLKMQTSIA